MKFSLVIIGIITLFCSCSQEAYNSRLPLDDKLYVLESKSRYIHFKTATKKLPEVTNVVSLSEKVDGDYIIRRNYRSKFIYSR